MSSAKITLLTNENTCNFCNNALAKYSCPKCNLLYCALTCYQSDKHLECSETFYKNCVQEQLESEHSDGNDAKDKMQEILKRFHDENQLQQDPTETNEPEELDSDDDEFTDLGERLTGIDLDDSEQVWKHLTEDERKDFEAFLLSGDASQFITPWTPWWSFSTGNSVLDMDDFAQCKEKCPQISNIKKFNEICGKAPASCVENNLINVLAAYTFLIRYFNGDHTEFPKEFSMYLYNLSLNLKQNVNFDSVQLAIESVKSQCIECKPMGIVTDAENMEHIKMDVNKILAGPHVSERKFYLLSALSDVKTTLEHAKSVQPVGKHGEFYEKFTAGENKALDSFNKEQIKVAVRKIDYYLSFVNDLYRSK